MDDNVQWQQIESECTKLRYFVSTVKGLLINSDGAKAPPQEYKSAWVFLWENNSK